jgi:hypothetical protein
MVFLGLFIAMGILAMSFGASVFLEAQPVQDWPSTTGTVTNNGIKRNIPVAAHQNGLPGLDDMGAAMEYPEVHG